MICRLSQILFPVLFNIAEVQTCWHWTSCYLYLPICTANVNHFIASVRPLHLLFLEGFEYHRQSMILLSPLFRNYYQIHVLRIGGALTPILGVLILISLILTSGFWDIRLFDLLFLSYLILYHIREKSLVEWWRVVDGERVVDACRVVDGFRVVDGWRMVNEWRVVDEWRVVNECSVVDGARVVDGWRVVGGWRVVDGWGVMDGWRLVCDFVCMWFLCDVIFRNHWSMWCSWATGVCDRLGLPDTVALNLFHWPASVVPRRISHSPLVPVTYI